MHYCFVGGEVFSKNDYLNGGWLCGAGWKYEKWEVSA